MFKLKIIAFAVLLSTMSCTANNSETSTVSQQPVQQTKSPTKLTAMNPDIKSCTKVLLKTTLGDITVALYNDTPKHRDNFIKLVKDGYYDGVLFHRVIKDFMVQTGDGKSKNATADMKLGTGDPGYTIEAEFVYPKFFHKRGALAAARTGDQVNPERRSSGSQFYIVTGKVFDEKQMDAMAYNLKTAALGQIFQAMANEHAEDIVKMQQANDHAGLQKLQQELYKAAQEKYAAEHKTIFTPEQRKAYTTEGGTPHLDGQYTVFGEVVNGMEVVDKIQKVATGAGDRPVNDVKIIKATIVK